MAELHHMTPSSKNGKELGGVDRDGNQAQTHERTHTAVSSTSSHDWASLVCDRRTNSSNSSTVTNSKNNNSNNTRGTQGWIYGSALRHLLRRPVTCKLYRSNTYIDRSSAPRPNTANVHLLPRRCSVFDKAEENTPRGVGDTIKCASRRTNLRNTASGIKRRGAVHAMHQRSVIGVRTVVFGKQARAPLCGTQMVYTCELDTARTMPTKSVTVSKADPPAAVPGAVGALDGADEPAAVFQRPWPTTRAKYPQTNGKIY